jgi:acetyl esterase/lipase
LQWLGANAERLGIDRARIAMAGASAGGGLCAGLAQRAHDDGRVRPAFQEMFYPMLDDRTIPKANRPRRRQIAWRPSHKLFGWRAYQGERLRFADEPYIVPARRKDLRGLPPAWIGVGTLDLFFEENVAYARRLHAAGVACELDVVEGGYHGFELIARRAAASIAFVDRMIDSVRRGLAPGRSRRMATVSAAR